MIQRIQTLYMFLALMLLGGSFIAPVWYFEAGNLVERIQGFQYALQDGRSLVFLENIRQTQLFFGHPELLRKVAHTGAVSLGLINFFLLLWMIFAYKKRKRQITLGRTIVVFTMFQILGYVYLSLQPPIFLEASIVDRADYGFGLLAFVLIFVWLANRGVRKDEALVRSVDRIR